MPEAREPFDEYIDTYQVGTTPYHGHINFSLSSTAPVAPGQMPKSETVGSIRMSLEAMKLLTFFLYRQMIQHERTLGVTIQLSPKVLEAVQIRLEDWEIFWKGSER